MSNLRAVVDYERSDWGASRPNRQYTLVSLTNRPGLEDHHSVGLYGVSPSGSPFPFMRAVQRDHLSRGWIDYFYNLCIWFDGSILEGRPLNATSRPERLLTILFPGNYCIRKLTTPQKQSWHKIRQAALRDGVGTAARWHALRGGSACPCSNVISWKRAGHPVGGTVKEPDEIDEEELMAKFGPPLQVLRDERNRWYLYFRWTEEYAYIETTEALNTLQDIAKRDPRYAPTRTDWRSAWFNGRNRLANRK